MQMWAEEIGLAKSVKLPGATLDIALDLALTEDRETMVNQAVRAA